MTAFVQLFKSTDLNAPVLTGQVGSLVTVLNKCLVDGYTAASVTSLVESGTNYTATLAVANTTLQVGQYIVFAGASPGGANIAMRINAVTDSTHVVCTGPGGLGTITGTITYAKAPLGWSKPFAAGTNAQTYRGASGNRFYLQIIDNGATAGGAKEAQAYAAEVMSADQAVTSGRFPSAFQQANGHCIRKSSTADATSRAWTLIGDDKTFYLICGNDTSMGFGFGDFISFKAGDAYNSFIAGAVAFNTLNAGNGMTRITYPGSAMNATTHPFYVPRVYTQLGTSVLGILLGLCTTVGQIGGTTGAGGANLTYPNPVDSGLYVQPIFVSDGTVGAIRGRLPGMYGPLHANPFTNYDTITGVAGLSGITLTALYCQSYDAGQGNVAGNILVDTFGPWT